MTDLSTKKARRELSKRKEPYWQKLGKGEYLGFRRGPDTWHARYRNRAGQQNFEPLGGSPEYDEARRRAQDFFVAQGSIATRNAVRGTVRNALETYIKLLRQQGREATADNAEDRCLLIVWSDPLADIKLEEMTREDMREWRERLRDGRQNRSVNRHVRSIVAGLNKAHKEGHIGNPEAWRIEPLEDDAEGSAVFLLPTQRESIISAASTACGSFLKAIEFTGGRPGELASATAGDVDTKEGTITLRHKKGRPAKIRSRTVYLGGEGAAFFNIQARGKLPPAPLLLDPEKQPWGRHKWADEVQTAIAKHNATAKGNKRIPKGVSAYSFRHARISELLQVHGIDPVTVAQQTGTSLRMIEKYYFKFIAPALKEKLAAIDKNLA